MSALRAARGFSW